MMTTTEDIMNEFIDTIGETAETFGLPRIAGLLKGLLFFTPGPLSLDEMADRLEVSKGSVSTNIRLLERWKVARRVYNRKDRKNYYQIRGTIWEIETEIVRTTMTDLNEKFRDLTNKGLEDIKSVVPESEEEKEDLKFLENRFSETIEYLEAVDHLMSLILRDGNITPATIKKIEIK